MSTEPLLPGTGSPKDLSNRRFGMMTAMHHTAERKGGSVVWHCRCDCGKTRDVPATYLLKGKTRNCGCIHGNKKDITGQRYGYLIAVERAGGLWKFKCVCGEIVFRTPRRAAHVRHCGCRTKELRRKAPNIIGKSFGLLTVLAEVDDKRICGQRVLRCRCRCGNTVEKLQRQLTHVDIPNCGCVAAASYVKRTKPLPKNAIDLTGKRFGKLSVEGLADVVNLTNRYAGPIWDCVCDCGSATRVRGRDLRSGNTTSCGCLRGNDGKPRPYGGIQEPSGTQHNHLTVNDRAERVSRYAYYSTTCTCGAETVKRGTLFRRGQTKSCGHLRSSKLRQAAI